MASPKDVAAGLLKKAGVEINGTKPWDLVVHNEDFYARVLRQGTMGFGEAYLDSWWDVEAIDQFVDKVLTARLEKEVRISPAFLFVIVRAWLSNPQSKARAFEVGEAHYDLGNDLYCAMLDSRMVYTCGYWKNAKTLDEAQEAKLDLVCRKIGLKKGDRVLDIGCGWGSFAKFAAEKYGAEVVGTTISVEQAELARKMCAGLPIEIRVEDYRETKGEFDHVVSLGMFEHVGEKNYKNYFDVVERCLKPEGIFLLHTIGRNTPAPPTDPWMDKYIFPNGYLPSIAQIAKASEDFVMDDWHNFGADYDKTLMAWFANFDRAWPTLKEKYGERFYRMWKYYLLSCAGNFRSRNINLWQIVFTKRGVRGGYQTIR